MAATNEMRGKSEKTHVNIIIALTSNSSSFQEMYQCDEDLLARTVAGHLPRLLTFEGIKQVGVSIGILIRGKVHHIHHKAK